jgi:hypothetical protein
MSDTFPTARSLHELFHNESLCLNFLRQHGAFDIPDECTKCGGRIAIHGHHWKCTSGGCRKQESFLKTSFFGQSRLPVNEVLEIGYYWLVGCGRDDILKITGHSPNTITDYMNHYRHHVASSLESDDTVVGGEGVEVQVDESKFGKRKYNRGHRVEGVWVIGGVELSENRKMFVEVIDRRDHRTIVEVLSRHILPGSIIVSDCWKGYCGIDEELPLRHLTVNHSKGFVNPENSACTNHIEGTWAGIKRKISPRNRVAGFIKEHLLEFVWRRKHADALWSGLLASFSMVAY